MAVDVMVVKKRILAKHKDWALIRHC
jgi:hypothetical protein